MVMDSSKRRSWWGRGSLIVLLFLSLWLVVVGFSCYSFISDRSYKVQYINNSLQQLNKTIARDYAAGRPMNEIYAENLTYYPQLRLTLLDLEGVPLYDTHPLGGYGNHSQRPEVQQALAEGSGFTVRRVSESTSEAYFYSALLSDEMIVRSALPSSTYIQKSLRINQSFIWYVLAVSVIISVLGVVAYRRIRRDEMRIEMEHKRALFEQSEKIRIKRQLTNNINHELKTPVCVIKGSLETLVNNPNIGAEQREKFLKKSLAQTERLESLLQAVSTITRMEDAPQMLPMVKLNLRSVINDAVEELPPMGERLPLRIHIDIPEDNMLPMKGQYDILKSLFVNLLQNAISYSGGRDIYINYCGTKSINGDQFYQFSFADNGIGVEPEHLSAIFERFYRVDGGRSRRLGGTGLGLSIVRNAVLMHGGTIEAKNRTEGGLQFDFSLKI